MVAIRNAGTLGIARFLTVAAAAACIAVALSICFRHSGRCRFSTHRLPHILHSFPFFKKKQPPPHEDGCLIAGAYFFFLFFFIFLPILFRFLL